MISRKKCLLICSFLLCSFNLNFASSTSNIGDSNNSAASSLENGVNMTNGVDVASDNISFLASVAKQPGVVETSSGLLYKVIQNGQGESPSVNSVVTVNYEGRLPDGKVFDSSYQRGVPASFGVSDVISGWTEALQLMSPGSVWELYIPPNLAYGARGVPGIIPPNSVLVFKVDLIKIN